MAMTVRRLIERAAKIHGNESHVAAQLGVTRQRLYEWKTGARLMPLSRIPQLAALAGCSPEATLAEVVISRFKRAVAEALTPRRRKANG